MQKRNVSVEDRYVFWLRVFEQNLDEIITCLWEKHILDVVSAGTQNLNKILPNRLRFVLTTYNWQLVLTTYNSETANKILPNRLTFLLTTYNWQFIMLTNKYETAYVC